MSDKKSHRFKCLVDQVTGQVVWLTYYLERDAPSFDPSLNYYCYNGFTNIPVWTAYLTYELYLTNFGTEIELRVQTPESKQHFERIQMLRAKAIALDYCYSLCNFHYDKQGHNNDYAYRKVDSSYVDNELIIEAHQFNYGFVSTKEEAKKLFLFKCAEYQNTVVKLECLKIRFVNDIKHAKTLEEVAALYNIMTSKMFNINRTELLKFQAIYGILPGDNYVGKH